MRHEITSRREYSTADSHTPQSEGYEVEYVQHQVEDRLILEAAYQRKVLLITLDKDFERLVLDEHRPTASVLHVRIRTSIPIADRAQILVNVLRHRSKELQEAFITLTETIINFRRPIL